MATRSFPRARGPQNASGSRVHPRPFADPQGRNLAAAIEGGRDNAADSIPLFLPCLDWRGVYTRRYTYAFDTSGGTRSWYRRQYFNKPDGVGWNCLWDHERDPAQMHNLYESEPRLRKRLHEESREWMRRFADTGTPYERVLERVFTPEDRASLGTHDLRTFSGVLRGRPVDLL